MDNRRVSEEYQEIGQRLIETKPELEHIKNSDVQIIFLASEHEKKAKGKRIFGQCEKIQDKYKWGIPCDFTITIFEPNAFLFDDKQLEILIYHELLHVGIEYVEGVEKYSVIPHDLEDFSVLIDEFGTYWGKVEEG